MRLDVVLPALTSILALIFSLALFDQWRERRGGFQLIWAIGMLFYGVASGCEALAGANGWNETLYRSWYLTGAVWTAGWLGLGTCSVRFEGDRFLVPGASTEDMRFGAVFSLKAYPASTAPGLFDHFDLDFDSVVTHSFTPVEQFEALARIRRTVRQMGAADDAAASLRGQLIDAADDLASGRIAFGLHHHPLHAALVGEIVDVVRANSGVEHRADVGERHAQGVGLAPVDLQLRHEERSPVLALGASLLAPPEVRPDARMEFAQAERLREAVIGARIETRQLHRLIGPRCQHDDGHIEGRAQAPAQVRALERTERKVQQDDARAATHRQLERRPAIRRGDHAEPLRAQVLRQGSHRRFFLDDQEHRRRRVTVHVSPQVGCPRRRVGGACLLNHCRLLFSFAISCP